MTEILREILRSGKASDPSVFPLNVPLLRAAKFGLRDIVRLILSLTSDINAQDTCGWTALTWAISKHCPRMVEDLLASPGIDLEVRDNAGQTAQDVARFFLMCCPCQQGKECLKLIEEKMQENK